jgi:hypothetical protein
MQIGGDDQRGGRQPSDPFVWGLMDSDIHGLLVLGTEPDSGIELCTFFWQVIVDLPTGVESTGWGQILF